MTASRARSLAAALCAAVVLASAPARSQDYPARPIKIIVPLAAGGLADTLARIVSQRLAEASGQSVVVENRPGAAGAVGAEAAARAPADGYTLFMGGLSTNAVLAHLVKLSFDPNKDLVPITHVATFPNVLVVTPDLPAKSVQELVAYAKANPGKLSNASQGNAASGHLVGEQFKQFAGIQMVHVPYRGGAAPMTDLLGGTIDLSVDTITVIEPQLRAGNVRALGVTSGTAWWSLPDVTPIAATVPDYDVRTWLGLAGPKGTPAPVVARLNAALRSGLADSQVDERLRKVGMDVRASSPEEMRAMVASQIARWKKVVADAKIPQQ